VTPLRVGVARDGLVQADGRLEDVLALVTFLCGVPGWQAVDRLTVAVVDGRAAAVWAAEEAN